MVKVANGISIFLLVIACIQLIAYLVAFWFINKQKPIHQSVLALWTLGMIYAVAGIGLKLSIIDNTLYSTWYGTSFVWFGETSAGIQHWLFGLEYYCSAYFMKQSICGEQPNNLANVLFKQKLFWIISVTYAVI